MRVTTWAVFGSLFINLVLGLLVAALFTVAPPALAAGPTHCTATHAVHKADAPARSATPKGGYVVAARMGWAAG
jgi:hypothetical protein